MIRWIERLVEHLAWANRRALEAVRRHGDEWVRRLMAHVLAAERVWLRRIRGGDSSGLEIWPDRTLAACAERLEANVADYRRLLARLEPGDLDREVAYRTSRGERFETPLGEILLHVTHHGAHHRGQIARRVRRAGAEPPNTDVITFVREDPGDGTAASEEEPNT